MEKGHYRIQKQLTCLLSCLIISGCTPGTSTEKYSDNNDTASGKNPATSTIAATDTLPESEGITCDCNPAPKYDSQKITVSFSHWNYLNRRQEFDSLYRRYAHDSIRLRVKAIELYGFDTIPAMVQVFKNVEHFYLIGTGELFGKAARLKGLDSFSGLSSLNIEGCNLILDSTESWLKNLEVFFMSKSKVKGISSFKQLPRLKALLIGHSGFDVFPRDFNSLLCLQELNIEEYKFGIGCMDLRNMNLTHFKCLRKLRVWGGSGGLPQGLDSAGNVELVLRPWMLNATEQKAYSAYKKRRKPTR